MNRFFLWPVGILFGVVIAVTVWGGKLASYKVSSDDPHLISVSPAPGQMCAQQIVSCSKYVPGCSISLNQACDSSRICKDVCKK